jgi:electron transport complex protein RnfG
MDRPVRRPGHAQAGDWTVRKDGGDFAYMTGATISARAVVRATGRAVAAIAPARERLFALPVGEWPSGIFTPKMTPAPAREPQT